MPHTYELREDAPHKVYHAKTPSDGDGSRKCPYPERVAKDLRVEVVSEEPNELVVDIVGIDVSIANALRRIMIAEVPTIAIERVYVNMNTSILHDEMLAHRLGLIPIDADPRKFEMMKETGEGEEEDEPNEHNTVVFKLHRVCENPPPGEKVSDDGRPYTRNVTSGDLQWIPQGSQLERFPNGIHPVHGDILLAKLRPGQVIQMELHCRKGRGKSHAKFSPVATASYRMLPVVTITQDIVNESAEMLVNCCPMKVFDIEDMGSGQRKATVSHPRKCTMCRECIRDTGLADSIKLQRCEHFIYSIEAVGMLQAKEVLREAVGVLKEKCHHFLDAMEKYEMESGMHTEF